jgi:hypothetical protein
MTCIVLGAVGLVGEFLIPNTGELALLDELLGAIFLLAVGAELLKMTINLWKTSQWFHRLLFCALTIVFLGVGAWVVKDVALDLAQGSTTIHLSHCTVDKTRRIRSFHVRYYLYGTDDSGKRHRFKITSEEYYRLYSPTTPYIQSIRVVGYVHTGRVIHCG